MSEHDEKTREQMARDAVETNEKWKAVLEGDALRFLFTPNPIRSRCDVAAHSALAVDSFKEAIECLPDESEKRRLMLIYNVVFDDNEH